MTSLTDRLNDLAEEHQEGSPIRNLCIEAANEILLMRHLLSVIRDDKSADPTLLAGKALKKDTMHPALSEMATVDDKTEQSSE